MPSWAGLWNNEDGAAYSLLVGNQTKTKPPGAKVINKLLRRSRYGMRGLAELMETLNGASAGSAALSTIKRVQSRNNDDTLGGVRLIETRTIVDRNTTADDKIVIDNILKGTSKPTYPTEKSGNGGGGKLGF